MKLLRASKSTSAMGVASLAGALVLGQTDHSVAQNVPQMTIEIHNSSTNFNIYPVLSTGTSATDPWLQAALKIPKAQLPNYPFPKANQFRLYINPTGNGIPPGGSVTLKLPLYTQLVPSNQVDPKKPDQYIDWWGGGRIEFFEARAQDHRPPAALRALYPNKPGQVLVNPIAGATVPTCPNCQPLKIFKDPAGLRHNEPTQLTEYTLGALDLTQDPIGLNVSNVDFDVSYVDDAYLPIAMAPFGNAQVGYVGTPKSIAAFRKALNKFIAPASPYNGWPQYVDNQGATILKIPSPLHIMAGGDVELTPKPWPPINTLRKNWHTCTSSNSDDSPLCRRMRVVKTLFVANYNNYKNNYIALGCDASKAPVELNRDRMLQHVYGWGPFNENCPADANLLENTPGYKANNSRKYQQVKNTFDLLHYQKNGKFNPYVLLIHGEDYIDAPNVYAYSVDDAMGNMQVDGTGLIVTVGGTDGLPNPRPATPPIHVAFGYSPQDNVRFTKYGICTATPDQNVNPNFASFDVSATNIKACQISLVDNQGVNYTFKIKTQPPYPETNHLTPETHAPIDCSGNTNPKGKQWCDNTFAYTVKGLKKDDHFVIAPAPAQG